MSDTRRLRQAVVVIHGIGEQRPMATIRGFTRAVLPKPAHGPKYWSHPDRMSGSFELRTLRAYYGSEDKPMTDFFEGYWAFNMRDTKLRHVLVWLRRLLLTVPWGARWSVRIGWFLAWGLALSFLVFAATSGFQIVHDEKVLAWLYGSASGVSGVLLSVLGRFTTRYLGDAARYLTPDPENIAQRRAIRSEAIGLLRELHRCEKYDRIIVVGHSLGSVIAYDVLGYLWDEYRERYDDSESSEQPALERAEDAGAALHDQTEPTEDPRRPGEDPEFEKGRTRTRLAPRTQEFQDEFRRAQLDLWLEQRRLGNRWLVTDLITLGSPLTHAEFLSRAAGVDIGERMDDREMSRCPPLPDAWTRPLDSEEDPKAKKGKRDRAFSYEERKPYAGIWGNSRTLRVIIPSAMFGFVRWTNFWLPGDPVGGPLAPVFGAGVHDVELELPGGWWSREIGSRSIFRAHGRYWCPGGPGEDSRQPTAADPKKPEDELRDLRRTLDLWNPEVYRSRK